MTAVNPGFSSFLGAMTHGSFTPFASTRGKNLWDILSSGLNLAALSE